MMTLTDIKDMGAYGLAGLVGVASPDSLESPGAEFLIGIRDSFVEMVSDGAANLADLNTDTVDQYASETVDSSLIYTHASWQIFVDLAAYQYNIDPGLIEGIDGMTERAQAICAEIGRTLMLLLWQEYSESN